nr:hypothetical protein [Salmonella enterica]
MTMSRVISLAAGLSLSVLFSTAAVADNGRGSGNSNIENTVGRNSTARQREKQSRGASSVHCRRIYATRTISAEM